MAHTIKFQCKMMILTIEYMIVSKIDVKAMNNNCLIIITYIMYVGCQRSDHLTMKYNDSFFVVFCSVLHRDLACYYQW